MSFGKTKTVKITDSRAKILVKEYEVNLKIKVNGKYTNFELDSFVNKKSKS